jgi:hypothetical protein
MVSRVFDNPLTPMLEVEEPANLPAVFFIEISLYSLSDNSLVYNTTISTNSQTNVLFTKTLQYSGQQVRKLLFVDFSKEQLAIPDGEYQAVVSFFVGEIGSLDEKPLFIHTVSPSRREVELRLLPEYKTQANMNTLLNISRPQINSESVMNAVRQIFGQPTQSSIPSDNTSFTYGFVTQSLPDGLTSTVTNQLLTITNTIMSSSFNSVTASIQQDIQAGKVRFSDIYLNTLISDRITAAYNTTKVSVGTELSTLRLT